MTANITGLKESSKDFRNRDTKELVYGYKLIALEYTNDYEKKPIELIDVRFYTARSRYASVFYCFAWIGADTKYGLGSGKAGGYGYDKRSASLESALRDAGIVLDEMIGGVGEQAEKSALKAIGDAFGYPDAFLVEFHP